MRRIVWQTPDPLPFESGDAPECGAGGAILFPYGSEKREKRNGVMKTHFLLEKTYKGQGPKLHGRIFWGGQNVVNESIRDSTFEAYWQVLDALCVDIADLLPNE